MLNVNLTTDTPNLNKTIKFLKITGEGYGIPFSLSAYENLLRECTVTHEKDVREYIKNAYNVPEEKLLGLDFGQNMLLHDKHIVNVFIKIKPEIKELVYNPRTSKIIFRIDILQKLIVDYAEKDPRFSKLVSLVLERLNREVIAKGLQQLKPDCVERKCLFHPNPRDEGIYIKYPEDISFQDTLRVAYTQPSISGKNVAIKSLITAFKGCKIIDVDVSGQELHIAIFGVMRNKELQRLCIEKKSPYMAALALLGYPEEKWCKDVVKIPMLGCLNGKTLHTSITSAIESTNATTPKQIEYVKKLVKDAHSLIVKDIGYQEICERAVNSYSKMGAAPFRYSLFRGTRLPITAKPSDSKFNIENKIRNGFFQVTAAQLTANSLNHIFNYFLRNQTGRGYAYNRPLFPAFDQVSVMVEDGRVEETLAVLNHYFSSKVDGWAPLNNKFTVGCSYVHR